MSVHQSSQPKRAGRGWQNWKHKTTLLPLLIHLSTPPYENTFLKQVQPHLQFQQLNAEIRIKGRCGVDGNLCLLPSHLAPELDLLLMFSQIRKALRVGLQFQPESTGVSEGNTEKGKNLSRIPPPVILTIKVNTLPQQTQDLNRGVRTTKKEPGKWNDYKWGQPAPLRADQTYSSPKNTQTKIGVILHLLQTPAHAWRRLHSVS